MESKLCPMCQMDEKLPNGYCRLCKNLKMKWWREAHPLNKEQRKKMNCRAYAKVYLKRGKLIRRPCEKCGDRNSQMHHSNYDKPLLVTWLCRPCHLLHHRFE